MTSPLAALSRRAFLTSLAALGLLEFRAPNAPAAGGPNVLPGPYTASICWAPVPGATSYDVEWRTL